MPIKPSRGKHTAVSKKPAMPIRFLLPAAMPVCMGYKRFPAPKSIEKTARPVVVEGYCKYFFIDILKQ